MSGVDLDVDRHDDHLSVRWADARAGGSCRFDRIVGTSPEWLGSAEDLFEGADRRQEQRIVVALSAWAEGNGLEIGIWHDDAGIEILA